MLSLAIKARIPIISVHTTDLLNLGDILSALAPGLNVLPGSVITAKADVLYSVEECSVSHEMYEQYAEAGKVLILVNQADEVPFSFNAGEVPVPKSLMEDLLSQVVPDKKLPELLPCFNGLTLKAMAEVIRLVTARDKSLTAVGVTSIRAQITGKIQGLGQVDTLLPLYMCPPALRGWVELNKEYFLDAPDERLIPRGILLAGEPGVGKSQGAKFIANEFGVPLYRLDLSSSLGKWVGESEANLSRILATLDQEEPCALLIDEIEKLFAEREDSNVTSRLLAQLLWWLQEHRSRVLTVMTTNSIPSLPKELYRAGRIDMTLSIPTLSRVGAEELAKAVLEQFLPNYTKSKLATVLLSLNAMCSSKTARTAPQPQLIHAEIVQMVYDLVKKHGWSKPTP